MGIFIPTTNGGTISASDSDSITSDADVTGLPLGTVIWNIDVGAYFKLTASTAALVTDEVLAVKNRVGSRWILVESGDIPDGSVTMAKLADIATLTVIGRVAASTGVPKALTATELTTIPDVATASLKGLMSAADKTKLDKTPLGWTEVAITPGANVDIPIAGETAYCVEISGYIVNGTASASTYSIQPESSAADGYYQELLAANTSVAADKNSTLMPIGYADASQAMFFDLRMFTKAGIPRAITGTFVYLQSSTVIKGNGLINDIWLDAVTPISNVRLHSNQATGFGAGTVIRYRIIPLVA